MVDQTWLLKKMEKPHVVILHVGTKASFSEGHIRGAQLISPQDFAVVRGELYWELPERDAFKSKLSSLGITDKSRIILYYGIDNFAATFRLYFTLSYFGLAQKTRILDGGLKAWEKAGLEISKDTVVTATVDDESLELVPQPTLLADKDEVLRRSSLDNTSIIDARREGYYNGTINRNNQYERPGHIQSAANICWLDMVDEDLKLKPLIELQSFWEEQGIEKGSEVISYCHVGLRASVIFTISQMLGYKTVKLYDGSFNEWHKLPAKYGVEK